MEGVTHLGLDVREDTVAAAPLRPGAELPGAGDPERP